MYGKRTKPYIQAPCAHLARTSFTSVGNEADSRGLAQCRDTGYCTPPNVANQPRGFLASAAFALLGYVHNETDVVSKRRTIIQLFKPDSLPDLYLELKMSDR
jgi:hypothetical protein